MQSFSLLLTERLSQPLMLLKQDKTKAGCFGLSKSISLFQVLLP
ncbi:hypothetical protein STRDD11_00491 [Streptococcus sp. DD11]|nr:hypothetical protein STRDD11_00491 [Streptococcus sp. DD11]